MATKITAPVAGFTGRTSFGPLELEFVNGVAEVDGKVPDPIRTYMVRKGYTFGRGTTPTSDGPFDPGKHTADEVLAHLAGHEHGSEEYVRVVQAERDGKARKGLLEAFDKADAQGGDGTQDGGDGS